MTAADPTPTAGQLIQARNLQAGMTVLMTLPNREEPYQLQVVEAIPTGSVKMGHVGPDAVPMIQVRFRGMPRPFKGTVECAGDQLYMVLD